MHCFKIWTIELHIPTCSIQEVCNSLTLIVLWQEKFCGLVVTSTFCGWIITKPENRYRQVYSVHPVALWTCIIGHTYKVQNFNLKTELPLLVILGFFKNNTLKDRHWLLTLIGIAILTLGSWHSDPRSHSKFSWRLPGSFLATCCPELK